MNTFGKNLRLTTFGESHGLALGAVIDGCPSKINLNEAEIQQALNRRKPGQSKITTQRKEKDQAQILSGVFAGKTLGTPIAVMVFNQDQKSKDYNDLKNLFRPGHADLAWQSKFGFRDYRGGGRSSGRETIGRVIGGVVAQKILPPETQVIAHTVQVNQIKANNFNEAEIENNLVRCADPQAALKMEECILKAMKQKESVGGKVQIEIFNCPKNLGEPVFSNLKAKLAQSLLSLGAVLSVEFGQAAEIIQMYGSQSNQNSFGISGGISTGEKITITCNIKPTPSIAKEQTMLSSDGSSKKFTIQGRHDPCILPRIIPVLEAMIYLVLADLFLENNLQQINK